MSMNDILTESDAEIARLKQVRSLLVPTAGKAQKAAAPTKQKRKMSKEARERIAEAQRKRWAKQKKKKSSTAAKKADDKVPF
jgi:nicotinic acid mononucleotide adenylyltransferase